MNNEVLIISPLEKVFADGAETPESFTAFSMLKNEVKAFQAAFAAKKGEKVEFEIQSPLKGFLRLSYVKMIRGGLALPGGTDDYFIKERHSEYPDLLLPLEKAEFTAEYSGLNCVWIQLGGDLPAGEFEISIKRGGTYKEAAVRVEIIDALLPKQELIYTNWFHTDCLMSHYGFKAFSPEYWQCTESFLQRAVQYGMNCVLTPLFTPPLDTQVGGERPTVQLVDVKVTGKDKYAFSFGRLDKWLEMCDRCGIEYYEMSHLFTQWGARHAPKIIAEKNGVQKKIFGWRTRASGRKYRIFISQFARALKDYINEKSIANRCIFHVSDEPAKRQLRAYSKAARIIRENFGEFIITDALSDFSFYEKGVVKTPIPASDHIEPFIGKVPELWTYYCGAQGREYVSNRFFAMPAERNRIIGFQLYKFDVKGFLHWGYNFYYSRYSKRRVDPFTEPDAGGKFPSGDSFVVYPGKDRTPLDSTRLHVFFDGLQDMRALRLLESLAGREKAHAVLEEGLEKPLTFSEYPHSAKWLFETRERINSEIKSRL